MRNSRAPLSKPKRVRASGQQPAGAYAQRVAAMLAEALGLHQQGQLDQAQLLYQQILHAQPQHFDALQFLAMTEAQKNNLAAARVLFERVLAINPKHANALNNYGNVLRALKCPEQALASYDRALEIKPDYVEALGNRGAALIDLSRPEEALASYERALQLNPNSADVLRDRGIALRTLARPLEALASYDRALQIKPDYAEALSYRGNVLMDLERPEEALVSHDRALKVKPDFSGALNSRGVALHALLRHAEALESFDRAPQVEPDYPDVHWNEALCRLLMGEFAVGWAKHEWRWKTTSFAPALRNFPQPLWLGEEPLVGKTILLHAEQGLGDTIQFCRYTKQVAALGARVVLEVQPALKSLLQGMEGASLVIGKGERLPDFDYHCPLLSLPLAFHADLSNISGQSYLQSEPAKLQLWQDRLGTSSKKWIGLAWSGARGHKNDHNRSLSLQQIAPLISDQGQYYCLQKELRSADQATLQSKSDIEFLGTSLKDFSDTAAVVELMDLVITVDTSVAHLAGAMGKEVWILLPFSPDWRWLLERSDCPWYSSARLFRQPAPGDWASVLGQVQEALTERLK